MVVLSVVFSVVFAVVGRYFVVFVKNNRFLSYWVFKKTTVFMAPDRIRVRPMDGNGESFEQPDTNP